MGSSSALNRGFDDTLTKAPEKGIPVVAIDTGIDNAWLRTMSQLGQARRFRDVPGMSGLPQTADISGLGRHFAFVPITEVAACSR
jgi:hypothetical protein